MEARAMATETLSPLMIVFAREGIPFWIPSTRI